jgi:ferritin-like protein
MANEWHVPYELLNAETQDMARAIQSLIEELEAVDWYNQRAQVTHDQSLRQILEHNRDEEKEHASMVLEWIRRRDPKFDVNLRSFLFTSGEILEAEVAITSHAEDHVPAPAPDPVAPVSDPPAGPAEEEQTGFTVGSLRPGKK